MRGCADYALKLRLIPAQIYFGVFFDFFVHYALDFRELFGGFCFEAKREIWACVRGADCSPVKRAEFYSDAVDGDAVVERSESFA